MGCSATTLFVVGHAAAGSRPTCGAVSCSVTPIALVAFVPTSAAGIWNITSCRSGPSSSLDWEPNRCVAKPAAATLPASCRAANAFPGENISSGALRLPPPNASARRSRLRPPPTTIRPTGCPGKTPKQFAASLFYTHFPQPFRCGTDSKQYRYLRC